LRQHHDLGWSQACVVDAAEECHQVAAHRSLLGESIQQRAGLARIDDTPAVDGLGDFG